VFASGKFTVGVGCAKVSNKYFARERMNLILHGGIDREVDTRNLARLARFRR
jgi:hypothetical protein